MRFPGFHNLFSKEAQKPGCWLWLTLPLGLLFGLLLIVLSALNPRSWKFNTEEARALLRDRLQQYESMSVEEIRANLSDETCRCVSVRGPSGEEYQIEVEGVWNEDGVRLIGGVDDGRLRAFFPLCEELLIARSESNHLPE